jgi:hypothetical protein
MPADGSCTDTGVIILGMHRSGTSLAAEIAYRWGAYADTSLFIEPNDGNPRGYWEPRPLLKLNNDLLATVHSSWKVPPTEEGRKHLARLAKRGSFRHRAHKLLATMNPNQNVWLWKDPRLCILLLFWKEILGTVVYLVSIREPMAIASSLCARRDFSVPSALLLWQKYMSTRISDEDGPSKAFFFSYEELLHDSPKVCDRICRFLDKNTGMGDQDRGSRLTRMLESVKPPLNRNKAAPSFRCGHGRKRSATGSVSSFDAPLARSWRTREQYVPHAFGMARRTGQECDRRSLGRDIPPSQRAASTNERAGDGLFAAKHQSIALRKCSRARREINASAHVN